MHPLFIYTDTDMITILKTKTADEFIAVELDCGETLTIPRQAAGLYGLAAGQTMDRAAYEQLKAESQRYRCRMTALDYLAICPRSLAEMERQLVKKGFDHDLVTEITSGLVEAGYIDDADYATRYITNRLGKKLVGKHLLARELQKRGVHRDIIRQALKESAALLDTFDDVYAAALKKYATLKDKKNGLAKLAYFLQGRGFDGEMIASVIEKLRSGERE
jgi:regulatory protein